MAKNNAGAKRLKITLVTSPIGFNKTQAKTVQGMGLRRINHSVELLDTPETREFRARYLTAVAKADHDLGVIYDAAKATLGDRLAGVVLFGSWARDDVATDSDIDVLLVARAGIPIVRSLYQKWDNEPLAWESHAVEPHIVALPETAEVTSGLWAEVALDGIVIHDPHLMVSRMLANVRRRILDAQLVRRSSGGQTYWVGAR